MSAAFVLLLVGQVVIGLLCSVRLHAYALRVRLVMLLPCLSATTTLWCMARPGARDVANWHDVGQAASVLLLYWLVARRVDGRSSWVESWRKS